MDSNHPGGKKASFFKPPEFKISVNVVPIYPALLRPVQWIKIENLPILISLDGFALYSKHGYSGEENVGGDWTKSILRWGPVLLKNNNDADLFFLISS